MEEVDGQWVDVRRPDFQLFDGRLEEIARLLDAHARPTTPITPEEFVSMYTGRKRVIYEQARQSLLVHPVQRKDAYLKTFVKCEKIDFTVKSDPAPRLIQPRTPRYNTAVGRFLKPLEHSIYDALNSIFHYTVVYKGLNAAQQAAAMKAAWDAIPNPVGVDLDASRWDRHVSDVALHWEHDRYLAWYLGYSREELERYIVWQYNNFCFAYCPDGRVRVFVRGRRSSGDMNTALGNVLLMLSMLYTYFHVHKGWALDKFKLVNNGDDSVVIISRHMVPELYDIEAWFLGMGFLMKVGPVVDVFEKITFCQTQPVFDGTRYVMCRDPRTALKKDALSILPLTSDALAREWMGSVGECGLSLAGNLPIYCEFYNLMVREGTRTTNLDRDPAMESGMRNLALGMHTKYSEPTTEARVSFWRAFGVDGTTQRLAERHYAAMKYEPGSHLDLPEHLRPETRLYQMRGARGPHTFYS